MLVTLLVVATLVGAVLPTRAHAIEGAAAEADPDRLEIAGIPGGAYNTDLGLTLGGFLTVTKFDAGVRPFAWRLALVSGISLKDSGGGLEVPLNSHNLKVDAPGLWGGSWRVQADLGIFHSGIPSYYGLGNASIGKAQIGFETFELEYPFRRFQYERTEPFLVTLLRYDMVGGLFLFGKIRVGYAMTEAYADSKLEEDAADGAAEGIPLYGLGDDFITVVTIGVGYDTRDDELDTKEGQFHDLSLRGAPGGLTGAEHEYVGLTLSLRGYLPLWGSRVVLAGRLLGDVLWGDVPFYELDKMGGFVRGQTIGGFNGLRGIPNGRFGGKIKLLANLELRVKLVAFEVFSIPLTLSTLVFFDTGRVWAGQGAPETLDGEGIDLKYGFGAGLRLLVRSSMVIRIDVAKSPDSEERYFGIPLGIYFLVGHTF